MMGNSGQAGRLCMRNMLMLTVFALSLIVSMPSLAATDKADLLVSMKILPLLAKKITGPTSFAIIYNPADTGSSEEAKGIKAILEGNFETPGNIKLISVLVPVNNLGLIADSRMAILTSGLKDYYEEISKISIGKNILTMSTDLACVRAGKCVIGIVSKPMVDIYYSKAAADTANIVFSQIFTLLAKQM